MPALRSANAWSISFRVIPVGILSTTIDVLIATQCESVWGRGSTTSYFPARYDSKDCWIGSKEIVSNDVTCTYVRNAVAQSLDRGLLVIGRDVGIAQGRLEIFMAHLLLHGAWIDARHQCVRYQSGRPNPLPRVKRRATSAICGCGSCSTASKRSRCSRGLMRSRCFATLSRT